MTINIFYLMIHWNIMVREAMMRKLQMIYQHRGNWSTRIAALSGIMSKKKKKKKTTLSEIAYVSLVLKLD